MRGLYPRKEPLTRLNRAMRDCSTLSHKGRGYSDNKKLGQF
jgi:hypothetical protein